MKYRIASCAFEPRKRARICDSEPKFSPISSIKIQPLYTHLRALIPAPFKASFTSPILTSSRWKIPAARAASTSVPSNTSTKCSFDPAPLLATTGTLTFLFTRSTSWRSPTLEVGAGLYPAPTTSVGRRDRCLRAGRILDHVPSHPASFPMTLTKLATGGG